MWSSLEGEEILRDATAQRLNGRESCLIVLSSDGKCEVYCDKTVDVHIAQRLHTLTQDEDTAPDALTERVALSDRLVGLADSHLEAMLPKRFQRCYKAHPIRAFAWPERITAADRLRVLVDLQVVKAIRSLAPRPEKKQRRLPTKENPNGLGANAQRQEVLPG